MSDQLVHPQDSINHALLSRIPRRAYPEIPAGSCFIFAVEPHPENIDRRLKGYQLAFLLVGPPPDVENRIPLPLIIPMHGHLYHGWLLWNAWLKWPEAAVMGELRHDPGYGWIASPIIRPGDSQDDVDRIVHALAILQRRVPPQGRPRGRRGKGVGTQHDLDSFIAKARRQRDHHRQLGQLFTEESLAQELGLIKRTFQRGLKRCGLTWATFLNEP